MMRAVLLWAALAVGARQATAVEPAMDLARRTAFRIRATTAVGSSEGTATLLSCRADKGAYFATCYHVLHGATSFSIQYFDRGRWIDVATSDDCKIGSHPAWDVALLKVPYGKLPADAAQQGGILTEHAVEGTWLRNHAATIAFDWTLERHRAADGMPLPVDGYAYGYPGLNRDVIHPVAVGVWGRQREIDLRVPRLGAVFDAEKIDPGKPLYVNYLKNEITLPGMSGGPVTVGSPPIFAGLVFARIPDTQGLAISASNVLDALVEMVDQAAPPDFSVNAFAIPLPMNKDVVAFNRAEHDASVMSFDGLGHWLTAFSENDGHVELFRRFLEVRRDVAGIAEAGDGWFWADNLGDDARQGRTEVVLNGKTIAKGVRFELQPGENLLAVRKNKTPTASLSLNDFFVNRNTVDVSFRRPFGQSASTVLQLRRDLPAAVDGYVVYLTLQQGSPPSVLTDVEPMLAPGPLPQTWLDRLSPMVASWETELRDLRTGSYFHATLSLRGPNEIRFQRISPQTVDIMLPLKVEVAENGAVYRNQGWEIRPRFNGPVEIDLWFRLQVVASAEGKPWVALRALTGVSRTPIRLPILGDDGRNGISIDVDVRTIAAQALTSYFNRELLKPDQTGNGDVTAFISLAAGLTGDPVDAIIPTLLGFRRSDALEGHEFSLQNLSFVGRPDGHFRLKANGTVKAAKCKFESAELRNIELRFDIEIDTNIRENRLGRISVSLTKTGKLKVGPVSVDVTPCKFELEIDSHGKLMNATAKLQEVMQAIIAGCAEQK